MNGTVQTIFISLIGLLALAFFVVVFVDVAREHRRAKRLVRMEEEAAAIVAALAAFEKMRELEEKPVENVKEDGHGKDEDI